MESEVNQKEGAAGRSREEKERERRREGREEGREEERREGKVR